MWPAMVWLFQTKQPSKTAILQLVTKPNLDIIYTGPQDWDFHHEQRRNKSQELLAPCLGYMRCMWTDVPDLGEVMCGVWGHAVCNILKDVRLSVQLLHHSPLQQVLVPDMSATSHHTTRSPLVDLHKMSMDVCVGVDTSPLFNQKGQKKGAHLD